MPPKPKSPRLRLAGHRANLRSPDPPPVSQAPFQSVHLRVLAPAATFDTGALLAALRAYYGAGATQTWTVRMTRASVYFVAGGAAPTVPHAQMTVLAPSRMQNSATPVAGPALAVLEDTGTLARSAAVGWVYGPIEGGVSVQVELSGSESVMFTGIAATELHLYMDVRFTV